MAGFNSAIESQNCSGSRSSIDIRYRDGAKISDGRLKHVGISVIVITRIRSIAVAKAK